MDGIKGMDGFPQIYVWLSYARIYGKGSIPSIPSIASPDSPVLVPRTWVPFSGGTACKPSVCSVQPARSEPRRKILCRNHLIGVRKDARLKNRVHATIGAGNPAPVLRDTPRISERWRNG